MELVTQNTIPKPKDDDLRLKTFFLGQNALLKLFAPGYYVSFGLDAIRMPPDAKVKFVGVDTMRMGLNVVVWSSEFDPVDEGAVIPPLCDGLSIKIQYVPDEDED